MASADGLLSAVYRAFLAAEGFETIVVANSPSCLDVLRRRTPALLILDAESLRGAGAGILAWMGADAKLARVPVLMLLRGDSALPPALPRDMDCTLLPRQTRPSVVAGLVREAVACTRTSAFRRKETKTA